MGTQWEAVLYPGITPDGEVVSYCSGESCSGVTGGNPIDNGLGKNYSYILLIMKCRIKAL